MNLLANRYAVHAAVLVLAFSVTGSNLAAAEGATSSQADGTAPKSILASLIQGEEEEVVVEESATQNLNVSDVSYLGAQAVSIHDSADGTAGGTDDGQYVDDESELALVSSFSGAVRVQPQADTQDLPPTRTRVESYVVTEGDTIGSIARKFGLRTETLLAANALSARSVIRIGQELKIMPVDGIMYKAKKGDTIAKIAKTYKAEIEKILEANGLSDGSELAAGMELILPDGRLPPPPPPKAPARIATDLKNIFVPPRDDGGQFLWPTAVRRITQYFKGRRHTGVDIAGPTGTPIYAADDGVVVISGWNRGGYGNMILVDHGNGLYSRYAHSSKNLVKAGDTVKRGDQIANMGSTGRSTGPHLHFEIMRSTPSNRVNPLEYVR